LALDVGATELEDDGKGSYRLVAWGFRCAEPGYLTDTGMQQKLQTKFLKGTGGIVAIQLGPHEVTPIALGNSGVSS
jgi:hypothetical protein